MKEEHKAIVDAAFAVIKDEKLPIPIDIKIRHSVAGTMKRKGSCYINYTTGDYKISIVDTKCKFFESPDGKYTNTKTGKKMAKDIVGIKRTFYDKLVTMAHEIAHLKFWKHDQQHKEYTNHILNMIIIKLGGKYDSARGTFCE